MAEVGPPVKIAGKLTRKSDTNGKVYPWDFIEKLEDTAEVCFLFFDIPFLLTLEFGCPRNLIFACDFIEKLEDTGAVTQYNLGA